MGTSRVLTAQPTRPREEAGGNAGRLDLGAAYDAHAGALYRYLLTLLANREEAEDALHEVMLGLLRRRGRGQIRDLRAYLFQAARRQAFQAMRRRRRDQEASAVLSWVDLEACDPADRDLAIDLDRALAELPAEQRGVIALKLGEDLTFREIAALLDLPANTAASRYRLALARLRRLLESGES